MGINEEIAEQLKGVATEKRAVFNAKLVSTISPHKILGIPMADLRKKAREIVASGKEGEFLAGLPHLYLEQDIIHMILINQEKDLGIWQQKIRRFLPFIDNWMVCDAISPTLIRARPQDVQHFARQLVRDVAPYSQRLGIVLFMQYMRAVGFDKDDFRYVCEIRTDHYYVDMARAWYFATAFEYCAHAVKDMLQAPLPKGEGRSFSTLNEKSPYEKTADENVGVKIAVEKRIRLLTIRKICESLRTSEEEKKWMRNLRRELTMK